MFCQEILIASQSLLRGALAGVLLSAVTLAGTHEPSPFKKPTEKPTEPGADTATRPRLREAAPSASAIRSVKVTKDFTRGGALLATIELDGQAKYNHFTLPSPYRLVVDVQNVSSDAPPVIPVGMSNLKRVRLGKMDDSVRIVFDAAKPQPYEINDEGATIRIWFGELKAAPVLATKPPAPLPSATATAPATPQRTKFAPPTSSLPVAASTRPAPVVIHNPVAKPSPVQLPASAKASVKPFAPRIAASLFARKFAPPTNGLSGLAASSKDAPPPRATSKAAAQLAAKTRPQPMPTAATQVMPQVAPQATPQVIPNTPAIARTATGKAGARVVTATPTPITAPITAPVTTSTPASQAATATSVRPAPIVVVNKSDTTPATTPVSAPVVTPRPREVAQTPATGQAKSFNAADYVKPDFVGEPINLDLRSTQGKVIDIRDFLRFISDTYKVNFVIDQSVREIPITVTLQSVPWNQAMEALLRANRLGVKVEGNILRVMSQETIAVEDRIRQEQIRARQEAAPLITEMVRLNYARALTGAAPGASGSSSGGSSASSASAGGSTSGASSTASGSGLDGIIRSRLSQRGSIQADPRTNTLIITDISENVEAIKEIIVKLDVPEPQVEIESRIVIANRNFARDLGVQLGAVAIDTGRGGVGTATTLPNPLAPRVPINPASGAAGTTGTSSGGLFGSISDAMRAAGATFGLGLTTGVIGTTQISAILTASEQKGNVKTISSPRITALNNQTANIVNGVQIPVQTESNNTLTVTFVTAALRLEITPQINDSGNVLLKVVAENNSVNTAIATRSAPGINTQRAETTVLVPDGGTTIIGGINIDVESNAQQRTPGVSRIPGLGELFKRRTVSRQTDEILFFITPRIYRPLTAPTGMSSTSPK
jgi:type IV pilus assembly protein PilQ